MLDPARYESAKQQYARFGVDTDEAIRKLQNVSISMHCWQGDDVRGFDNTELSGGIEATGNYPGRARTPDELMSDITKALSLIPGTHRLNLHACYAIFETPADHVTKDKLEPKHFSKWVEFAKSHSLKLDFNPTCFSDPMVVDNLTLSSPNPEVRKFWIDHCKACRKIGDYFGRELGSPCLVNLWIPDGFKEIPADRMGPRMRLKTALDEIYAEKFENIIDSVESKLFGIGVEAMTVGSHEFYLSYAARNNILCLLDSGHFHPTEAVSDKIASMLVFFDKLALHVSRPMRWDSDHVVLFDDEVREIAKELVRNDALDRVLIATDYFDASINRIAAWVNGMRNLQMAILYALLLPHAELKKLQDENNFTRVQVLGEVFKTFPFGDVWDKFCEINKVPIWSFWMDEIEKYETEVLSKRQ